MQHWLFKSEPETFSIDDLSKRPKQTEHWDGVRNYQARNMLRDAIKKGDQGFFYHSSCEIPGIVGIFEVVKEGYGDHSALDPESTYFDPESTSANPRWYMVDIKLVKKFPRIITLQEIKQHPKLSEMLITRKGNRLSITPVTTKEWQTILHLAENNKA
ncbi:MAG: EVE domain-containing protein [Gammaproteobacteria bacterium RIFCSPHIGHO2_12_FULL_43_28]|nr:MAG: EVE domain-containing protein [Gammaproteobacteria bacterium RIFCSPHIGHO2_12_FULL_43_28]